MGRLAGPLDPQGLDHLSVRALHRRDARVDLGLGRTAGLPGGHHAARTSLAVNLAAELFGLGRVLHPRQRLVQAHGLQTDDPMAIVIDLGPLVDPFRAHADRCQDVLVLRHRPGVVVLLGNIEVAHRPRFIGGQAPGMARIPLGNPCRVTGPHLHVMLQPRRVGPQPERELAQIGVFTVRAGQFVLAVDHALLLRLAGRRIGHSRVELIEIHAHHVHHGRADLPVDVGHRRQDRIDAVDATLDHPLAAVVHQLLALGVGEPLACGAIVGVALDLGHDLRHGRAGAGQMLLDHLGDELVGLAHRFGVGLGPPQALVVGQAGQQMLRTGLHRHRLIGPALDEADDVAPLMAHRRGQVRHLLILVQPGIDAAAHPGHLPLAELALLRAIGGQAAHTGVDHRQVRMHVLGIDLDDPDVAQIIEALDARHAAQTVHDGHAQLHLVELAAIIAALNPGHARRHQTVLDQIIVIEGQHGLHHRVAGVEVGLNVLGGLLQTFVRQRHVAVTESDAGTATALPELFP